MVFSRADLTTGFLISLLFELDNIQILTNRPISSRFVRIVHTEKTINDGNESHAEKDVAKKFHLFEDAYLTKLMSTALLKQKLLCAQQSAGTPIGKPYSKPSNTIFLGKPLAQFREYCDFYVLPSFPTFRGSKQRRNCS